MFKWDSLTKLLSRAHTWTGVQTLTSPVLTSPALNTGVSGTAVDTDNTLAANSDTLLASQKAVKAHVAAAIAAIPDPLLYKGVIDCSTSPNYPAADAGHVYVVSVAGLIGGGSGTAVAAGDTLLCRVDSSAAGTQAAVGANWNILEKNINLANVTITGGSITGITDLVVADGGTGVSTLTDHGILVGSGTDAITALAVGTNGQVLVGSTGADPTFATITDGEGIDTTLGAGTLTIACEDTSEANKGVVELATDAETIAGSDTARAITAANLKAKLGTQTDGGLLVGAGQTAAVEALGVGATTEVLVGGGAGTNPVWTTATGTGAPVRASSPILTDTPLAPTASDNTSTTQIATAAFAKSQDAVLARDPDQGVALTAAASGGTGITVTDNANIDNATNNFTIVWKGLLPNWTPSGDQYLSMKGNMSDNGWELLIQATTGIPRLLLRGLAAKNATVTTGLTDGTEAEIVVVVTRETASVAGSVVFYVNGVQLGDSVAITAGAPADLSNAGNSIVMGTINTYTYRTAGTVHHAYTLNFAPTAAEVLDMYRNGIPEAQKWGSQTGLVTGTNSDMSGANSWANASFATWDINSTVAGKAYALEPANGNGWATLANVFTIGKRYRVSVKARLNAGSADELECGANIDGNPIDGIQQQFNFTPTGTEVTYSGEIKAGTTTLYLGTSSANSSAYEFDDVSVVQIGATLALLPENIQQDKWYDATSNSLNASYPTVGWSLTRPPARRVKQPTPTAKTTAVTLTIAELLTSIITGTHTVGATQAYTLPTGTLCDAWPAFRVDDHFDWVLINLSAAAADTITVTAGADHTLVGEGIVQSAHASTGQLYGNSAKFRTRKTAANTFVTYRIG